jgi:hypothetical protein
MFIESVNGGRTDRREDIFVDDVDREAWLEITARCCGGITEPAPPAPILCTDAIGFVPDASTGKPNQNAFIERFNRVFREEVPRSTCSRGSKTVLKPPGGGCLSTTSNTLTMLSAGSSRRVLPTTRQEFYF